MKTVCVIGFKEFRDRLRSGWIVACMVAWLAIISLTSALGLIQMGQIGVQGYERTTISLLNLVQYLVPLLALLVGHDLVVREREDRTLALVFATGVHRTQVLFGKFLGGALTIAVPLVLGFSVAGVLIGLATRDTAVLPFLKLSCSGLLLGVTFTAIGVLLSTLARTRVQALVLALLTWGTAVFAFDLAALGVIVSTRAVQASHEVELVCDATHVNDIHAAFDGNAAARKPSAPPAPQRYAWLCLNPVDLFRVFNLPGSQSIPVPGAAGGVSIAAWLVCSLGLAVRKLNRIDL